ncbi:MAG: hypothetical protein R3E12_19570 [Candidatus Eisenbacteria bacterium]
MPEAESEIVGYHVEYSSPQVRALLHWRSTSTSSWPRA